MTLCGIINFYSFVLTVCFNFLLFSFNCCFIPRIKYPVIPYLIIIQNFDFINCYIKIIDFFLIWLEQKHTKIDTKPQLTLVLLNTDVFFFENSKDPNQLALDEAI